MSKRSFFSSVHALVAVIPKGKVMTYGQIASVLESRFSAQFVGFAMHAAPEGQNIPCHRVINRKGEMAAGGLFGGAEAQRKRLQDEGVQFLPDGRVDLAASLWIEAQAPEQDSE